MERHRTSLFEVVRGREIELATWKYNRREAPEVHVAEPVEALTYLKALTPWLELDGPVRVEWVAHTQALLVRTGDDVDAEEGVLYFHEGRGALRYLGLRADGSVVHGDVVIKDGSVVRIELDEDSGVIEVRVGENGTLQWVDG
jgi:hypothetical protein